MCVKYVVFKYFIVWNSFYMGGCSDVDGELKIWDFVKYWFVFLLRYGFEFILLYVELVL